MKKSCFFVFLAFLFVISCSKGEDPLIPCVTVSDCPDSSYSCFDGFCVHAGAVVDPTGQDSGDTLPDGDKSDGDTSSENKDNNDDSGLPDTVKPDDDGNSESQSDKDSAENSDKDNAGENDSETDDEDAANENNDKENGEDADNTEENDGETNDGNGGESGDNESDPSLNDGENSGDEDADSGNGGDADVDNDADHDVEIPAETAACADAIAALPHGGKYDWDDGTTQGFSTNNYWNLVESSVISARSGNYSFGKYSANKGYSQNMDYTSALGPADLSACKVCMVKATFYAKGKNYFSTCTNSNRTFIHPTCNGEGVTTATNSTGVPWSQTPASPWVSTKEDSGVEFLTYATGCRYTSETSWVDEYHNKPLMWTIPDTCMTDEFVFGLRFRSDSSVEGHGLVVDDLTIYATTKNEPKGEFESAENGKITGWACDPDAYPEKVSVKVRYYKNKDESVVAAERSVDAESERTDLTQCDETYNHGFEIPLDAELAGILGIGTHSAAVFAADLPAECAGTYKLIGTKDFEITSLEPKQQ